MNTVQKILGVAGVAAGYFISFSLGVVIGHSNMPPEPVTHVLTETTPELNTIDLDTFECLAKNIYYEAATESYRGKLAVAQVTMNRVASSRYPNDICDVVYQYKQFSWTLKPQKEPKGKPWEESKQVAYEVLVNNKEYKQLKEALFYHADYVKPYWADKKFKVKQVDTHVFYTASR
jgi:N-acetylmuramoyl-L-alanine amidase